MLRDLEKIFNFIIYFYSLKLNIYVYSRKNFFLGKLGVFNFFFKKFSKNLIFIINFYKKIFLKIFLIKINSNILLKNDFKLFDNYNFNYYNNLFDINKLSIFIKKIKDIFYNLGFLFFDSPEIDNDFNNFYSLNISKEHTSISFKDTFYLNCDFFYKILLRTHSSNFQYKLKYKKLPLKYFTIGKVYRPDSGNFHLPIFTQLDLVWIDNYINFIFLKKFFLKFLYILFLNKKIFYRFRSSYFPFTNISYEIDLLISKKKKWLEFCGLGLINTKILNFININSEIYNGFAIGMGIERLMMIYYNIYSLNFFY